MPALTGPAGCELAGAHEVDGCQLARLAPLNDRLCDLRREEAQSEDAREVRAAQADLGGEFADRLSLIAILEFPVPETRRNRANTCKHGDFDGSGPQKEPEKHEFSLLIGLTSQRRVRR